MAVLPGVLGCSFDFAQDRRSPRRTVQVRLGPIPRDRGTVARGHVHLRNLATAIHEISGLKACLIPGKGATYDLVFGGWGTLFYIADCGMANVGLRNGDCRHFRSF